MSNSLYHIRRLTIALFISGGLNVIMLSIFCYWMYREIPPTPYCEMKPANKQEQQSPLAIDHSNSEVIRYFKKMPLEWLVGRLSNSQLVESGYTQRDLALASLIAYHHLDLNRAISNLPQPTQKRTIVYGKFRDGRPAELTVYPDLSDKHFEAILAFASTERWPLTSEGLFLALRKEEPSNVNVSLADTFFMTPEFSVIERIFSRGEVSVDKNALLKVLLEGNWKLLSTFVEQQKASQDLSPARRQRFLLDYIQAHSKAAAYLILKTDGSFAANKLDDSHVVLILQLLEEKTSESDQFAKELLSSPRSDKVWQLAATRLYEYAGESIPEQLQHNVDLTRFMPQHTSLKQVPEISTPAAISAAPPIPAPPPRPVAKTKVPPPQQTLVNKPAPISPPIAKRPAAPTSKPIAQVASPQVARKPIASNELVKGDRLYIIQDGDSLWKISQRFNIDMQAIKAYNKLDSDALRPGQPLRIPAKAKA